MKKSLTAAALLLASTMVLSAETVTTVTRSTYANQKWYLQMNADFTKETGIQVQVDATPGTDDDHTLKVNVDLLAGGNTDVIETLGPRDYLSRVDAGFFMPLNDVLAKKNVNVKGIWGKYIQTESDGKFYSLPYKQEIFAVFYNKSLFDKYGVAYPKAPWTWKDYEATAAELTKKSAGKAYGSFMQFDTPYLFIRAAQKKVPFYKADGTSNFDDPAFAEDLKWYKSLADQSKIQMGVKALKAKNVSWDYYATQSNLGMFLQGNWYTRLLNSQSDYPKDWKYGIVATPSGTDASGKNNFTSMGYLSINKNAAHVNAAVTYTVWRAQNQWKYEGGIPALVNLTPEQNKAVFEGTAKASGGSITVGDLQKSLIDTGLGVVSSDISGVACAEYNQIIKEEAELYCYGNQDLPTTIKNIVTKTNAAIKAAQ